MPNGSSSNDGWSSSNGEFSAEWSREREIAVVKSLRGLPPSSSSQEEEEREREIAVVKSLRGLPPSSSVQEEEEEEKTLATFRTSVEQRDQVGVTLHSAGPESDDRGVAGLLLINPEYEQDHGDNVTTKFGFDI
jgi:hypothetical protein